MKGGTTYRILSDQVGSVRLVVNADTGAVAQRIDYDAFGVVTQDTNPGFQPFGFAGGVTDPDTGLVRFGARDYDPRVGRWTSKDPIRLNGGTNIYEYALNNPVIYFDPDGRNAIAIGAGVGSAGGPVGTAVGVGIGTLITVGACLAGGCEAIRDFMTPPHPVPGSKPKNCPPGTIPIDQTDLDRDSIHKIKDQVGAGPRDWVGVSPDGDVYTGDSNGEAVNNGPVETYLP